MDLDDDSGDISTVEKELMEFDYRRSWNSVYQRLKNEASAVNQGLTHNVALLPENRPRNRYRDVIPYDHSRVCLNKPDGDPNDPIRPCNDYINASHVHLKQLGDERHYILTQGPTADTKEHFWLMVWQHRCKAIVMLNRVFEKGILKCFPYFPIGEKYGGEDTFEFPGVGLRLTLLETNDEGFYVKRLYELVHIQSQTTHQLFHFHYLSWPDFGVPQSASPFLNFLLAVRRSGAFCEGGPVVVHCSAGVGRSGTFILVEAALLISEKENTLNAVDIRKLLMELRSYRMGLIQTWEQLRFSYQSIIQGGRALLACIPEQRETLEFSMSSDECKPPKDSSDDDSSFDEDDKEQFNEEDRLLNEEIKSFENSKTIPLKDEICLLTTAAQPQRHKYGKHGRNPYETLNIGGESPNEDINSWMEEQKLWQRMCSYKPVEVGSDQQENKANEEENIIETTMTTSGNNHNNSNSSEDIQNLLAERSRMREARRARTQEQIQRMQRQLREQNLSRFRLPTFLRQNVFLRHNQEILALSITAGVVVLVGLYYAWS